MFNKESRAKGGKLCVMEEGTVVNWCKEGNPKADAYRTALNSLQCVLLLLSGVGEGKAAIFKNGSDVGHVY